MSGSDVALLEKWVTARDADAFAEIVSRYSALVYGACKRVLGNPVDAEDVTQECFLELAQTPVVIKPSLPGWLYTMAVHRALNRIKANKRRLTRESRFFTKIDSTVEPAWDDLQAHVDAAIAELPPELRELIILRFLEGHTHIEIADHLSIPRSTVQYRIEKGLEKLREILKKRGIPIAAPALGAMLFGNLCGAKAMAAPPAVIAHLGKLAILASTGQGVTGTIPGAVSSAAILGGAAMTAKKALAGTGVVVLLLAAGYWAVVGLGSNPVYGPAPASAAAIQKSEAPSAEPRHTPEISKAVAPAQQIAPPEPLPAEEEQPTPPPASISGYVADSAGRPFQNASVYVEVSAGNHPTDVSAAYSATSGSDGAWEITGISAFGKAIAYAYAANHVTQRHRESVQLSPGTHRDNINFTLKSAEYFVAGWVLSENRQPIPNACIGSPHFGYTEEGFQEMQQSEGIKGRGSISYSKLVLAFSDQTGYFVVAVPNEGFCDFTVTAEGHGQGFFPKVHTGTEDARFILRSGGAISGKVAYQDGKPAKNVTVEVSGEAYPGGLEVGIQSFRTKPVIVNTDADGKYLAKNLGEAYVYAVFVPDPEESKQASGGLGLRNIIAKALNSDDEENEKRAGLEKQGIRVHAGQTTANVNFVLGAKNVVVIQGTVTDRTTGAPVFPLNVEAFAVEPGFESLNANAKLRLRLNNTVRGEATTNPDGTYRIEISRLSEPRNFCLSYDYQTEGGSAWAPQEEVVASIELAPGDEEKVDFTVDAPLTVTVRYVDENGASLQGIIAAMRQTGHSGGCGGSLVSDSEGRTTFHGIPPFLSLQALAWTTETTVMGESEPFVGEPGATLPEVLVVCHPMGGIEGVLTDPDGNPLAATDIACYVMLPDGTLQPGSIVGTTDSRGVFSLPLELRTGAYPRILVGYGDIEADNVAVGVVENVEVQENSLTDLGVIPCRPTPVSAAAEMLGQTL